ncbi:MAG: TetR/AcrR family transcriptional regulator [Slackia sp.]|nr:TetR/AcrR family transcriptional regulator [Slackia sp.]
MGNKAVISREHILKTAYNLFRNDASATLSIRSVANACGVSVGSIYNYFPTKADLVAETIGMFWRESLHREMFIAASNEDFVAFCERLLEDLRKTLSAFRSEWIEKLTSLDTESLKEVRKREEAAFRHIRKGLAIAISNDRSIDAAALEAIGGTDKLATLVWGSMVASLEHGDDSCETLLALMRKALY